MSATLGFYGGVGSVTGANFMLDTGKIAMLVDCGMVQGDDFAKDINREPFLYDPSKVDVPGSRATKNFNDFQEAHKFLQEKGKGIIKNKQNRKSFLSYHNY